MHNYFHVPKHKLSFNNVFFFRILMFLNNLGINSTASIVHGRIVRVKAINYVIMSLPQL